MKFLVLYLIPYFSLGQVLNSTTVIGNKFFDYSSNGEVIRKFRFKKNTYSNVVYMPNERTIVKRGSYFISKDTIYLTLEKPKSKFKIRLDYHVSDSIDLNIKDIITNEPIPFCDIKCFNRSVVFSCTTNFDGETLIPKFLYDSLTFNFVGYNDVTVLLRNKPKIPSQIIIWMSPSKHEWEFPYLLIRNNFLEEDNLDKQFNSKYYLKKRKFF
jgi:hypothetical protein